MNQPIACTLSSSGLATRKDELAQIADRALRAREPIAGGERLTFAAEPETERDLRRVIAAEAECCAFLRFDLDPGGDTLALDITGPDDARPIIAELFARAASRASR